MELGVELELDNWDVKNYQIKIFDWGQHSWYQTVSLLLKVRVD